MVQLPKTKTKKPEVLGVTGVNFDSDEDDNKQGRYALPQMTADDDDIERDEALTLDELDGWMSRINQTGKSKPEIKRSETDD